MRNMSRTEQLNDRRDDYKKQKPTEWSVNHFDPSTFECLLNLKSEGVSSLIVKFRDLPSVLSQLMCCMTTCIQSPLSCSL